MSIRTERVASLIKEEMGAILAREYNGNEFGFITVTHVAMSPDLKIAKISLSVLGPVEAQAKAMKLLEQEKHHIRGLVASRVRMKFVPTLQFYLDDTMNRVDRINRILKKIHEGDNAEPEV